MSFSDKESFRHSQWRRLNILMILMIAGFVVVIARLAHLQLFRGEALAMKAERQHQQVVNIEGERGVIFDRAMRELAVNLDMPSMYGDPSSIENPGDVAKKISEDVDVNPNTLAKRLDNDRHFVWIKRRMAPRAAKSIESMNLKGIGFIPETKRFYPKKEMIGHILGFTDIDDRGMEGVERYYEKALHGKKGTILLERDARRRTVLTNTLLDPLKGDSLRLTIDEVIQHIMEKELASSVDEHGAVDGVGIAMDPYTGEILAMAVYPRFNPNTPGQYISEQWRNRAITDLYEPGSTFKFVAASGVLEEGLVSPNEIVHDGSGSMVYGGAVIHDPHPTNHPMTFKEVVAHSSNVGTAKISVMLGKERLYQYARRFGFGEKTGIDLPGEVSGIIRKPSTWSGRSLMTISIGQEVGVTPVQLITAMSAIANGGWLVRPHIVSEIIDSQGVARRIKPELERRVISKNTSRKMTEILKEAVGPEGTGKLAVVDGFSTAGKTGTAQKIDPETGRYSRSRFVSSFAGFVPADSPEIAILIVINEPKGIAWGGSVAAPVFKRVAEQTLQYMHVESAGREQITVMAQNP